ncbi:MAG: 7-carboxy-7-deazaguanine synthase QueE [Planctomycetota bacterium]
MHSPVRTQPAQPSSTSSATSAEDASLSGSPAVGRADARPAFDAGLHGRGARAPLVAVFASIQGEGAYVGEPQVFVRLRGCPLRCRWCDTPGSWLVPAAPADADWVDVGEALGRMAAAEDGPARTLSITGGEPLLWPGFVSALAAGAAPRRVHLETAGAHPRALAAVLERIDHVSLDLKLPADLDAPDELPGLDDEPAPHDDASWAVARRAVLPLVDGRDACGKLILAGGRTPEDFAPLLDDVVELAPKLPLVVQPATALNGVAAPSRAELEALVEHVLARGLALRVLPQVHRFLRLP